MHLAVFDKKRYGLYGSVGTSLFNTQLTPTLVKVRTEARSVEGQRKRFSVNVRDPENPQTE